jgi:very-short-patch-repair endonuclease
VAGVRRTLVLDAHDRCLVGGIPATTDRRLAIEVDGNGSHATPSQRDADHERSNQLPRWRFVRFTYEQVFEQPGAVAAIVGLHLTN